jgi:hypothetical protein
MSDWRDFGRDSTSPAEDVIAVDVSSSDHTPSQPYRALRANVAGTIKVDTLKGTGRTLNFADGETRAVYVQKVYQTGTTATGIEGML